MKKVFFLFLIALGFFPSIAYSQSLNLIERFQIDTTVLYNKIQSNFDFDCNNYLMNKGDLHIFPFYLFLDTVSHSKDDYIDYTFLDGFKVLSHTPPK